MINTQNKGTTRLFFFPLTRLGHRNTEICYSGFAEQIYCSLGFHSENLDYLERDWRHYNEWHKSILDWSLDYFSAFVDVTRIAYKICELHKVTIMSCGIGEPAFLVPYILSTLSFIIVMFRLSHIQQLSQLLTRCTVNLCYLI